MAKTSKKEQKSTSLDKATYDHIIEYIQENYINITRGRIMKTVAEAIVEDLQEQANSL